MTRASHAPRRPHHPNRMSREPALDSDRVGSAGGFARARPSGVGNPALPHGARPVRAGPAVRRRRGVRGRAAALPGALARRQRPGQARLGQVDGLPGLPRPALDRARPDEGRRPLRRRGVARRVRGARDVDDLEVRAAAAARTAAPRAASAATRRSSRSTSCGRSRAASPRSCCRSSARRRTSRRPTWRPTSRRWPG